MLNVRSKGLLLFVQQELIRTIMILYGVPFIR